MNRAKVINSTWEALAECDLLARVTNESCVRILRDNLEIIKAEITRKPSRTRTGVRSAATMGHTTNEPGSATTTSRKPGSKEPPVIVEAPS